MMTHDPMQTYSQLGGYPGVTTPFGLPHTALQGMGQSPFVQGHGIPQTQQFGQFHNPLLQNPLLAAAIQNPLIYAGLQSQQLHNPMLQNPMLQNPLLNPIQAQLIQAQLVVQQLAQQLAHQQGGISPFGQQGISPFGQVGSPYGQIGGQFGQPWGPQQPWGQQQPLAPQTWVGQGVNPLAYLGVRSYAGF